MSVFLYSPLIIAVSPDKMVKNASYVKAIFDNSPEYVILIGPGHEVLAFNKKAEDLHQAFLGRKISTGDIYFPDFVVPGSQELYLSSFEKAMQGEEVRVHHFTEGDNYAAWFDYRMRPVYDGRKKFIGITLAARNIDAERQATLAVESLSDTLQAILDNTDEMVALVDREFRIIAINSVAQEILRGRSAKPPEPGADFRDFTFDDGASLQYRFEQAMQGHTFEKEILCTLSNGEERWYRSTTRPVYNKQGVLFGVSFFGVDVTAKRHAEDNLIESEDKFKKIASLAPSGIIITDEELNINFSNLAAEEVFGYRQPEMEGMCLSSVLEDLTLMSATHMAHQEGDHLDPLSFENVRFKGITKDGRRVPLVVNSSHFISSGKFYYTFLIQDISELLHHQSQISVQNQKLRDIAWTQSHVLRAPITRIMGAIQLMRDHPQLLTEAERQEMMTGIMKNAETLDLVLRDIVKTANEEQFVN